MTVQEFEYWVSDNYEELVGVANRVLGHREQAVDMLHDLVESIIDGRVAIPEIVQPAWFGYALKGDFLNAVDAEGREQAATEAFAVSLAVLGTEDTYQDTRRLKQQKSDRLGKLRRAGVIGSVSQLEQAASRVWSGNPGGTARWRYQQIRDDRLFKTRAIRSQADSLWATVTRQTHGLERGTSYTEFGQEVAL